MFSFLFLFFSFLFFSFLFFFFFFLVPCSLVVPLRREEVQGVILYILEIDENQVLANGDAEDAADSFRQVDNHPLSGRAQHTQASQAIEVSMDEEPCHSVVAIIDRDCLLDEVVREPCHKVSMRAILLEVDRNHRVREAGCIGGQ